MAKKSDKFWVYILLCDNGSYYTGYTNNLEKRYQSHVNGAGRCKYTRSFKPITIAQCWRVTGDKSLAMKIERSIKMLSREQKMKIIQRPSMLSSDSRVIPVPKRDRLRFICRDRD